MAMRKVDVDEIYISNYPEEMVDKEYLLAHVPPYKAKICKAIHHVDTRLRECEVDALCPEGKYWRVQGYLTKEDIATLMATWDYDDWDFTAYMSFGKDCIEIWSLDVPFRK